MDGLTQERAQQVRYHTNQLGGMELYRIYTDFSEKELTKYLEENWQQSPENLI